MLAALPDPILLADGSGRLTALNRPGEAIRAAIAQDHAAARNQILDAARLAQKDIAGDPVPIGLLIDGIATCYEITARKAGDATVILCRDVSAETSVREVLLESRQRYKQLVEIGADFVWECDASGSLSFVSEPGAFGYPPDRIVGRQPSQFVSAADGSAAWPNRIVGPVRDVHVLVKAADGQIVPLSLDAGPIPDGTGGHCGVRGVGRIRQGPDESRDRARANPAGSVVQAMRSEWRPDDMLHIAAAGVWRRFGAAGCVIFGSGDGGQWHKLAEAGEVPMESQINACLDALRGKHSLHRESHADGTLIALAVHCQGRPMGALVVWRRAGSPAWQDEEIELLSGLEEPCGIAVRQALEIRRLTRLSRSDSLTGLLNRSAFLLELTGALARAGRQRTPGALVYLDLDRFKRLNDLCGHEAGNEALTEVAKILISAIRPYDLAARLGGDEFAVWLEDISGRSAGRSARRIATAIGVWSARQFAPEVSVGASLGVAMFDPDHPESPEDLIERADRAMYRAKRTAGDPVAIARPRRGSGPAGKAAG
ncbi:MAG: diguanylate cyclase domain-containing protein [Alphaproteobacteria bacterium]